jgi:hypothetical protein
MFLAVFLGIGLDRCGESKQKRSGRSCQSPELKMPILGVATMRRLGAPSSTT